MSVEANTPQQDPQIAPQFYQVGRILQHLVDTGNQFALANEKGTPFHSSGVPQISIEYYFVLVAMNAGMQPEQATAVLILLERICNNAHARGCPLIINSLSAHR